MISEDLHLDMHGVFDQLFKKHFVTAERSPGFLARTLYRIVQSPDIPDNPHAAPAAAPTGLQHQGVSDCAGNLFRFPVVRS